MSKKKSLIALIFTALIGSFVNFYATNLLMSDLSNMFYGVHDKYIYSSFPIFVVACDFVLLFIFLLRVARYPQYKKSLVKLYTILFAINSLIGVVTTLISGVEVYKDFLAPYPFAYYHLIMYTSHILLMICCILLNVYASKKMEDDKEKHHLKFKYCIYSGFLAFMLYLAFYKLGSLVWLPVYLHLRTLWLTFPFYLWIALPTCLVIHVIMYYFDFYKNPKTPIVFVSVVGILNIVLGLAVIIIGATNSTLISAISPCLPLERLATKPYDVILEFVLVTLLCVYYLIYNIISYKKSIKNALN